MQSQVGILMTNEILSTSKIPLRSMKCLQGRRMAGARALWRANGMRREHMRQPIIAIANSFTQYVASGVIAVSKSRHAEQETDY